MTKAELERENKRLKKAICWALGETDFRPRGTGEGAFWWRTELRRRSGLKWNPEKLSSE
jgi:hypothetical protein